MSRATRKDRQREIRAIMVRKGIVAAQVARQLDVARQHVSQVISGDRYSPRVVDALVQRGVPRKLIERQCRHLMPEAPVMEQERHQPLAACER